MSLSCSNKEVTHPLHDCRFAIGLNDPADPIAPYLPPTDTRFRPDQVREPGHLQHCMHACVYLPLHLSPRRERICAFHVRTTL
jgi:hypothetical protein